MTQIMAGHDKGVMSGKLFYQARALAPRMAASESLSEE